VKTRNKAVYVYSAAMSERKMTRLAEKFSGLNFEEKKSNIETVTREAFESLEKGDKSKMMNFIFHFVLGRGMVEISGIWRRTRCWG
jgi:hypothetical protein